MPLNPRTLRPQTNRAAPVVTVDPSSDTVFEGSTITFTASATGQPSPTVQWQLSTDGGSNWSDIGGATSTSYTTPTLTNADDQNQYRAVFTNVVGTATSNAATATVLSASPSLWSVETFEPVYHWS